MCPINICNVHIDIKLQCSILEKKSTFLLFSMTVLFSVSENSQQLGTVCRTSHFHLNDVLGVKPGSSIMPTFNVKRITSCCYLLLVVRLTVDI